MFHDNVAVVTVPFEKGTYTVTIAKIQHEDDGDVLVNVTFHDSKGAFQDSEDSIFKDGEPFEKDGIHVPDVIDREEAEEGMTERDAELAYDRLLFGGDQ